MTITDIVKFCKRYGIAGANDSNGMRPAGVSYTVWHRGCLKKSDALSFFPLRKKTGTRKTNVMKSLKHIICMFAMVVGAAFSVPAQSDDQKKPPKNPPVVEPGKKPPRGNPPKGDDPKGDDRPKKPGYNIG